MRRTPVGLAIAVLLPLFTIYFDLHPTGTLWPLIITYTAHGLTIDGAGMVRSFVSVGFPMVRNAIVTVALVQFFLIWNDLLSAITFANRRDLNTIQAGLLNFSGEYGTLDYGPLFAAICITVGGILVLYLFLNQRIIKGLSAGAVKG